MDYNIARTDGEINRLLNECAEAEEKGKTRFPGMTYEQGIAAGIRWVAGDSEDYPLED